VNTQVRFVSVFPDHGQFHSSGSKWSNWKYSWL